MDSLTAPTPSGQPDTLNTVQAAALLFADPEVVMNFARQGILPGTKFGKGWVFLREDVLAFVRARVRSDTEERLRLAQEQAKLTAVLVEPIPRRRRRTPPVLPALPQLPVKSN